jgi:hypothetical protein
MIPHIRHYPPKKSLKPLLQSDAEIVERAFHLAGFVGRFQPFTVA